MSARTGGGRAAGRPPGRGGVHANGRSPAPTRRRLLTWADRIVLYALVGLGATLLLVPAGPGRAEFIRIEGAGGLETTVPLAQDGAYDIPGPLGTTVVRVKGGAVRVEASPCRHQVCVRMGRASRPGAVIVCVPNAVVVRVLGRSDAGRDALTR